MAFWNRKTKEKLEAIPITPDTTITVSKKLLLGRMSIVYNLANTKPFNAEIVYRERPTQWGDMGTEEHVVLAADSWPELIDKVAAHFEEGSNQTNSKH